MLTEEIRNMAGKDKLILIEEIWEALYQQDYQSIDSPKWHKTILDKRRTSIESGNASFITIDDLKNDCKKNSCS